MDIAFWLLVVGAVVFVWLLVRLAKNEVRVYARSKGGPE